MSIHANEPNVWSKSELSEAILATDLLAFTNKPGTVTLHSSARVCANCHEPHRVIVLPRSQCVPCWSKQIVVKRKGLQK